MKLRHSGRHALRTGTVLSGLFLLAACSSLPSIGPNTASGLPTHVDGGAGQILRLCEKMHDAGDLTTAAAVCERAHRLDPSAPESLLELASILGEMGETDLSIEAYRTILKTSPSNAEAHYGLGRTYLSQGHNDLALRELQMALLGNPKDPRLYRAVGVANGLLGAHAQAQKVFRDGLLIAPEDFALRNNLGLSLVQSGRTDEGLLILQALAKNPNATQASRDNLHLAQGLAAAEHAEIMLAEVRAMAEAEAQAQAQAKAASLAAALENEAAKPEAAPAAAAPVLLVFDSQGSWPMDGPGEVYAAPAGEVTNEAAYDTARRSRIARALSERLESTQPERLSAPSALTKAMAPPPSAAAPTWILPASPKAKSRSEAVQAPRSLTGAMERQMAHADFGGASDAGPVTSITTPPARQQQTARATAPTRPATKPARGAYTVQFASYTSKERAWRGWDSLQRSANDLLDEVEPEVRSADLGGDTGIVYRLRTGPIGQENARSLCAALKAKSVDCLVVKSEPRVAESDDSMDRDTL